MSWSSQLPPDLVEKIERVDDKIIPMRREMEEVALANQSKVLTAFRHNHLSESHFAMSTGYGYDDLGRDALEAIYADVFRTADAIVRPQLISGTHAIATALFGVLRPGDDLLYITGTPYDTLLEVLGVTGDGIGSFKEYNIGYDQVALQANGQVDFAGIQEKVTEKTKVIAIQRSRGYDQRPSFTVAKIDEMVRFIRRHYPEMIIFTDNCYGEFAETREPTEVGVDLMAGSLIKNPGGGICKTGGYIVGREDLIKRCAVRLTTPGVGKEAGAMINSTHEMIQGFFLAPHAVSQAIQGAIFTAALLAEFEIESTPKWDEPRTDLIQMVALKEQEVMVKFCQAIQRYSPVDAHVSPIPAYMPGYEDDVIMAAGTFIQGASLELTADGPLRSPYILYVQGGLTYEHVKLAVSYAVNDVFFI
ncbi:methionine gamma-lyase family protein [Vagococcus sp. BWB3-3]|uniref:Methionine gamma-lyase family protein n=1 Tax=Vagococcus allomyrinae TaxID=2794353 RepID=A0A940PDK8_9ENTE|nr:methionine gamma-lyase family protein [Vagococcus allomyrinae]MBP1044101.1 methionine gamma-lyase family protein [Vagococcus allomyrinae]